MEERQRTHDRPPIGQLAGVEAIGASLARGADVRLLLVLDSAREPAVGELVRRACEMGIPVRTATSRVMTRLSVAQPAPPVLALLGRDPSAGFEEMLERRGIIWLLVGVAYPGNVGMVVRTAEVSGAEGVVVDADFDHEAKRAALRAAMRADRFMPVHWSRSDELLERAARANHQVVALDERGELAPWQLDLCRPSVIVVGGENGGIPADVLARCSQRVRVPMAGFIPCYNLQAAVSAVATERLRQLGS